MGANIVWEKIKFKTIISPNPVFMVLVDELKLTKNDGFDQP